MDLTKILKEKGFLIGIALNLLLWFLCLAPVEEYDPAPFSRSDLFYHGVAYAFVTYFFFFNQRVKASMIMLLMVIQGIAIEFIQPYFDRHFELLDILANCLGAILAFGLYLLSKKILSKDSTGPSR